MNCGSVAVLRFGGVVGRRNTRQLFDPPNPGNWTAPRECASGGMSADNIQVALGVGLDQVGIHRGDPVADGERTDPGFDSPRQKSGVHATLR